MHDIQNEKHVLFMPLLRNVLVEKENNLLILLVGLTLETGAFYFDNIRAEDVKVFLLVPRCCQIFQLSAYQE